MPIKASSAPQVEALVADLESDRSYVREAAVARLTVLGPRAVSRLLEVLDSASSCTARSSALQALEAIADPRSLDRVLREIDARDATVALAAISAARVFLRGQRGAAVVDRLTEVALDLRRDERQRVEAVRALGKLEPSTVAPLLAALGDDPSAAIRTTAVPAVKASAGDVIREAAERGLPDDPGDLGQALSRADPNTPLPLLLRLVERLREREIAEAPASRAEWTRVRGRAHAALAARGSRIALYDLRESFGDTAAPLPVEFLAALSAVGDASCLETVAAAYARSSSARGRAEGDIWWRDRLGDAFVAIVQRERMTRRHALIRKIERRWEGALKDLWARAAARTGTGRKGGTDRTG